MPAPQMPAKALPDARSWRYPLASPVVLTAAGLIAFALALAATLPARVVVPRGTDALGTVWHGAATLGDGATARWDWSPTQSLEAGAFAADWTINGPGTLLIGVARLRPSGGTEFATVSGRAGWPLLAAVVPGLPAGCTIPLTVALARMSATGSDGTVTSLAGSCPGSMPGTTRIIPRLIATFTAAGGVITPWTDRATIYATTTVAGGVVHLHVTPAGAAVLPGPGRAGDVEFAL